MHIDCNETSIRNEADVEAKVITPLLLGEQYLGFDSSNVFFKSYLSPTTLDKVAGKTTGYYPDYSIWQSGFLVTVVEAKAPTVEAEVGYREGSLYARHINQTHRTGLNPCRFVMSCNGKRLLVGYHDSNPTLDINVSSIQPGTADFAELIAFCGPDVVLRHATECLLKARVEKARYPFQLAGGPATLTARKALNTFAPDLSTVLGLYFSTSDAAETPDVVERGYVSSAEITEYDRVLEALLKDRAPVRQPAIVQGLSPSRRNEPLVTKALSAFAGSRPPAGRLQIIQGAVGTGKSIFIRRYKEYLQPSEQRERNRWAFIDFLAGPPSLKGPEAQSWICRTFYETFQRENPGLDLSSPEVHRGIYSRELQKRKPIYDEIARDAPEQAGRLRAIDFSTWQDNVEITARGLAEYVLGSRREVLITVMDNVDKLGLQDQLDAFELSLWFLALSRSFVILQMRDETYERFKDRPPLDTFRTSIVFHITPPRFIDVVKKRLDLAVEYLVARSEATQSYTLENGLRVTFPKTSLGEFLHLLYIELFSSNRNVARLVESMAGPNMRRALEIFSNIVTSGHLSTNAITSTLRGDREFPITDFLILKILMRSSYRLASDNSGFITNIFLFEEAWEKPDNFILIECLFQLAKLRRTPGQIGLEGYFTCDHVAQKLQFLGYPRNDVLASLNYLLKRELISADHQSKAVLLYEDTVRILPSGYMHLRVLPESLEYCFGVIPTTPIVRIEIAQKLANFVQREITRDDLSSYDATLAVETLYNYLLGQLAERDVHSLSSFDSFTGAHYVIERMRDALTRYWDYPIALSGSSTCLDEV